MSMFRFLVPAFLLLLAFPTLATAQVDINSADAKTLAESLSGVGLVRAEAIVAYRLQNGPFRDMEDLAKVKGIGKKTLDTNRGAIIIVIPAAEARAPSPGKPIAHPHEPASDSSGAEQAGSMAHGQRHRG